MAIQVNVHEAKTHLSRLLERAARGEEVVIARGGVPVARLVAHHEERGDRPLGLLEGQVRIGPDFDDDLPADLIASLRGERL